MVRGPAPASFLQQGRGLLPAGVRPARRSTQEQHSHPVQGIQRESVCFEHRERETGALSR